MDKKSTIALLIEYIVTRPIILKLVDIILVLMIAFGIATAYIISTNFKALFLTSPVELTIQEPSVSQVNRILEQFRNDFGGNRTRIFLFHGKYYSQAYERTSPGTTSEMENSQSIPKELDDKLQYLIDNKFQYDLDVTPFSPLGILLQSQGITQYYRHTIYNLDGEIIGFVTIEFFDNTTIDLEVLYQKLQRIANALSGALV